VTTTKRERPLSPHLQVYRWQITMVMSILHRSTGVALAVGAFGVVWWLLAVAAGPEALADFNSCAGSLLGMIALAGFSVCLVFHFFNGIRHLLWDIGWGFEIPQFTASGWTVAALTLICTAGIWFMALRAGGAA
jgi:succinate dehydrogenase / fumarate reductase, cytochrome b subunit